MDPKKTDWNKVGVIAEGLLGGAALVLHFVPPAKPAWLAEVPWLEIAFCLAIVGVMLVALRKRREWPERSVGLVFVLVGGVSMGMAVGADMPLLAGTTVVCVCLQFWLPGQIGRNDMPWPRICPAAHMHRPDQSIAKHVYEPRLGRPEGTLVYAEQSSPKPICRGACFDHLRAGRYTVFTRFRIELAADPPVDLKDYSKPEEAPVGVEVEAVQPVQGKIPGTETLARQAITYETGLAFSHHAVDFEVDEGEQRSIEFLVMLRRDGVRLWADELLLLRRDA